jgi:hypothetical protein
VTLDELNAQEIAMRSLYFAVTAALPTAALAGPPENAVGMMVERIAPGISDWCDLEVTDIVTSRFYLDELRFD